MNPFIETDRLIVREMLPEDTDGLFGMDSDPEVYRYLGGHYLTDRAQGAGIIEFIRGQYAEHGIGRWSIVKKAGGEFIGWTGFKRNTVAQNGHTDFLDFGYRLARRFWGKGLATEASAAALRYGIDTLGFTDIYAMTDVNNAASRHLLEKLGFSFSGIFKYAGTPGWQKWDDLDVTWYELHITTGRQIHLP